MTARCQSRVALVAAAALIALVGTTAAQVPRGPDVCGPVPDEHVQWDYRRATQRQRAEVEGAHFAPQTEALIAGKRGYLGGDMHYTLSASPNHHRALVALSLWSERLRRPQAPHMRYPIECYFDRAIRFASDDQVVRMLYGRYLSKQHGREAAAVAQLEKAVELAADNPFTQFNVGMIYFEMKRYDEALSHAHRAMALGMDRPDLKQNLVTAGKWVDPAADAAPTPAATPASAATPAPAASASAAP
jgi:hypothetical protein